MQYAIAQAWGLQDRIHVNHETQELDKGGDGAAELDYKCINSFSKAEKMKN